MTQPTDLEIARSARPRPIAEELRRLRAATTADNLWAASIDNRIVGLA